MDKERLQQHIDNFNQMCSELGEDDILSIVVRRDDVQGWVTDLKKGYAITSAELVKRETIKIKKE